MNRPFRFIINILVGGIFILFYSFSAVSQVTIFTENFENGGNMPNNWTQEYVVDTLNWVFTSGGHNGHPSGTHGGSFNGLLFYAGTSKKTKLVSPQLNLSTYSNLQLKFWHTQEEYSGDQDILKVYYKTSATGSWNLLQTYSSSVVNWTQRTITLPSPSSTYYIAFEGEAKYGYGICLDDLQITGNVTNGTDISCIGIDAPIIWNAGSNTLKITYKNMRSDTIKNADFGYKLNSGTAVNDTNKSTGTLLANQTGVYTFSSSVSVAKGNHTIKVWARKPNRKNPDDDPSNDTFSLSFGTGIKDTFIIDKKGTGDYTSFSAAVADLNNGVTGKVVFIVKPGTYTERVVIGDIPGTSTTNNVIFYSQYPDSVTLTYNSTSQSTRATLVYKGADYITFKNINITNSGATYGVCVLFRNKSNYNTFDNCKIYLSNTTTSQYSQIILGSSDESTTGTAGDNGSYNTFINCALTGGYYAVRWHGTSTAQPCYNNAFKYCTFTKQYVYGCYIYYQQGFELSYCALKEFRYNGSYGIASYYSMGGKYDANIIMPGYIGIYFYLENYYNQTKTTSITNNMISNFLNSANQIGIYGYYYCYNLNIYHNSIWVDGSANTYTYACINLLYYSNNSIIKNNLLVSTNGNLCISLTYANTVTVDYNDYYYNTSTSSFALNYTKMGFSTFKGSSSYINYPHDQNSFDNINPMFFSKTNLHLDTLNTPGLMAPYVGVAKDIDNNTRSTTIGVNLGADEIKHPSRDLDIISIDSPTYLVIGYNTISITLRNSGTDSIPTQKVYLSYNINGGSWVNDSLTLTQKIPPFGNVKFSFKTKWNVTTNGNYNLCVRIYPKIINDPDAEDKLCAVKCVGKSGTYIISAMGGGDYTTFNAALNSIQTCGIAGPVKFIVKSGTYVERVLINPIMGSSKNNTVTFEGVHKDSVTLIYSGTSTDVATVALNGADYITFRNIKIQNNGNTYGVAVHLRNAADSNVFENCILQVSTTISTHINCVTLSNSESSYATYGNTANYNVFKNNQILNGYFGVSLVGTDKSNLCHKNQFINNTITGTYYMPFYMIYEGQTLIKGNKISNASYTFSYGIYSYYNSETRIEDNVINPGYIGILIYRENDVFPTKKSYIINNMISNFANTAYHIGIYGYYYSRNLRIYHNSIWVSSNTSSATYAAIYLTTSCDSAIIKNNLIAGSNNAYLLSLSSCVGISGDYNDYYYPNNTSYMFYNNAAYSSFSAFKSSTGCYSSSHDQNSYDNKDPDFTSSANLHLKPNSAGLGGVTGLGVVYDLDGDYRCQTYPSLGADEGGAKADFTINSSTQCFDGHKFIFTNNSQGGSTTLTYKWEFGDGSTSTATNPQKTYSTTGTYNVKLIVYPGIGCNDTIVKTVTVNPSANASYNANSTAQCFNNNYFSFTNTSTIGSGTMTYYWDFGDGYSAAVTNANHVFDTHGTFIVKLIATSNLGCKDTAQKTITVYPKPNVSFTIDNATQCSQGNQFNFTNQSTIASGSMTYLWNFGDGSTSTQTSPSHSYSSNNTFSVKLIATSNYGCKDSMIKTTKVDPTPFASFTINDTSQCLNQNSFVFTNTTTTSGGTVSYTWYFGDNTTSTATNPTHVYTVAGTYQVKLVAGTTAGCKDSVTKTVIVHPSLIAGFTINNADQCFTANAFSFTNSTTTTTGTTSYYWSFGDNDSAYTKDATHSYNDIGTFQVEMLASSTNGCDDSITKPVNVKAAPVIEKDNDLSAMLADSILALYTLNSNTQDNSGNNNHATNYNATLTPDKCSRTDSAYNFNGSNAYLQAPHALSLTPLEGFSLSVWLYPTLNNATQYIIYKYNPSQNKGYQVRLYNNKVGTLLGGQTTVFYSDSTVKLNQWNHVVLSFDGIRYQYFINGKTAGSGTANYYYYNTNPLVIGRNPSSGQYFQGKMDEIRIYQKKLSNLEIFALYNQSPYVKLSGNYICNGNNANVYLYNSQSGVDYSLWDTVTNTMIGSKISGNGCLITLPINGVTSNKILRIKAEDKTTNCYKYFDTIIKIYVAANPVAAFSVNDATQCKTGNNFVFTNSSTISSGTMTYTWNFDDATTSILTNPSHTYTNTGNFTVLLTATSNYGCKDTQSAVIQVYPVPVPSFSINNANQCSQGNSFIFTNSSTITSGTISYFWRFGDGTTSTNQNPTKSYTSTGTFTVWLVVTSNNSCKDSISKVINVYPTPIAGYNVTPSQSCKNTNNFTFTNTSTISSGTMTYLWKFGDNTTSTLTNPSHSYSAAGTYNIVLVVTSNNGCKDSVTKTVTVHPMPVAKFIVPDSSQCFDGNGFAFVNQSTISSGSMTYLWDFGDNTTSTATNPIHSYTYADTFIVKLVVTSDKGCKDSISKNTYIHVNPMPNAAFSINDTTQCLSGNSYNFTDQSTISSGTFTRAWSFGDGASSTLTNPNHSYSTNDTFNVKLLIVSNKGCKDSLIKNIYVFPHPATGFSVSDTAQCLPSNSFAFSNTTTIASGTFASLWNFGDGNTSTLNNPTHSYSSANTFSVKLTTISDQGCKDSVNKNVYVYPLPVPNFTINDSTQCFNSHNFSFTDNSTAPTGTTYLWNFGDGATSTLKNPSHTYSVPGNYQVKLILSFGLMCKDSMVKNVYVYPEPAASFSINSTSQCLGGNNFNFTNTSTISSGSMTYNWNFGDASSSASTNPTHSYTSAGLFTVTMIATSNYGCKDTATQNVDVRPMPVAGFNINNQEQCMSGNSFVLTNTSTISSGTISYLWNFGDNSTSTATSPTYSYTSPGTYSIKLVVTSGYNCKDSITKTVIVRPMPVAAYVINDTDQCRLNNNFSFTNQSTISSGTISSYWTFGDNTSSTAANPSHSYMNSGTYSVKLLVTSSFACKDSMTKTVIVYPVPVAGFSINDSTQCQSGNSFTFTNQSTISGGTMSYDWNFGDNSNDTSTNPTHQYSNPGTYSVKLVVTSNQGCKDSVIKTITVYPVPQIAFTINDSDQCLTGNNFIFTNSSVVSSGTLTYFWQFGDNSTSTASNPTYSYTTSGVFNVKLVATTNNGCKDSLIKSVIVFNSPVAGFTVNQSEQCKQGNTFSFTNTSTIGSGTMTYSWSFGDNSTSTQQNPSHSYANEGTYTVKLIVTSNNGCKDSISKTVIIYPMPKVDFSMNDSTQCQSGNSFVFTNGSSVGTGTFSNLWVFGDNSTSTQSNPVHTYSSSGTFSVKLVVTTDKGCKDSVIRNVYVYPNPVVSFTVNQDSQCYNGHSFVFTNTSSITSGTMSYLWKLGDASTSTMTNVTKTYSAAGLYSVKLIATSNNACSDSIAKVVRVFPSASVNFSINDTDQCKNGNQFNFTNSTTITSGSVSYLWNFGDNTSSTQSNPQKNYAAAGTYTVKLIASTDKSCIDSLSKIVVVYPSANVGFTVNDTDQCRTGNSFVFTNTSTISSGTITNLWYLGDATTSTSTDVTKSYLTYGNFNVKLKVTSDKGCIDSASRQIYVYASPTAAFSINDTDQCLNGNNFIFTNNSVLTSGTLTSLWNFGDNTSSGQTSPQKSYSTADTYTVKLVVNTEKACSDSISKVVIVFPSANVGFTINDTDQCKNENSFAFTNTSTISSGNIYYYWTFGNGDTSTANNVTKTYTAFGNYTVKLKVTSDKGCVDSVMKQIYVYPSPVPVFSVNDTDQCLNGNSFVFTNTSYIVSGTLSSFWNIDDTVTSTVSNPTYSYSGNKNYNVKLKVTSDKGCTDSLSQIIYVYPSPVASFTNNDSIQCFGNNAFKPVNNSSVGSGTLYYLWNFGDGDTSSLKTPVHNYQTADTFIVKLKVTTDNNCIDSMLKTIYVKPGPQADFTVNDTNQCFKGNNFILSNKSQSAGPNPKYLWTFGDGDTSSSIHPTHSYKNPGTYNITLKVVPDSGCVDSITLTVMVYAQPSASFSINDTDQCQKGNMFVFTNKSVGIGLKYIWTFGDGGNASTTNCQHSYINAGTYSVKLKITSGDGCADSLTKSVVVYTNPAAVFSINDSTQCQRGNNFSFTDQTTGSGNSRKWYYGDGGNSTGGPTVNHAYTNDGTYNVSLVITSNKGCKDSVSKKVYIYPQPLAAFIITNNNPCQNENNVVFTNNSTVKNGTMTYLWSFGDAASSTLKDPTHHYSTAQTFNTKLVVTSNQGCKDSLTQAVIINPVPLPAFNINKDPQCFKNNHFVFLNNSTLSSGTMTYLWDFGDIYKSSDINSSHIYTTTGTFTVKLVVTSDKGCKDSISKQTTVYPMPKADFTVNQNPQCLLDNYFKFTNKSAITTGTLSHYWKLGDGSTSTANDTVIHTYANTDTFTIMLVSTSDKGCGDTIYKDIMVKPSPKYYLGKDVLTRPGLIYNIDAGPGYLAYKWFDGKTSRINSINTTDLGLGDHLVWVVVTDSSGCKASDTIILHIWPSSIDDLGGNLKYRVYPNPSRGIVNVDVDGLHGQDVLIQIFDVNGKIIMERSFMESNGLLNSIFELKDILKGVYFIKLTIEDNYFMEKVVIY